MNNKDLQTSNLMSKWSTLHKVRSVLSLLAVLFPAWLLAGGRPDVVLITIDTARADRFSGYGYHRNTSPNLDRLMAAGFRFDKHRTVEPLTAPASISMLTSIYPHQHGATRNGVPAYPDLESLGKVLSRNGYETAAFVGNWTLRDGISGLGEHFQHYQEVFTRKRWMGLFLSEATAEDITQKSLSWLKERKSDQPFFLWVHYVEPHAPYRLQKEFVPRLGLEVGRELPKSDRYDTEIAFTDHQIGILLDDLKKYSEDTLIIFTSDHGESLGEHDYWGHGRHLYEATLHIPMSITWPGKIPSGGVISRDSLILDIPPTVLGLMDIEIPGDFIGYDWEPVISGKTKAPQNRRTFYQAHKGAVQSKKDLDRSRQRGLLELAIIQNDRKEIFRVRNLARKVFDLEKDPGENKSLVKKRTAVSEALRRWAKDVEHGLYKSMNRPELMLGEQDLEMLRSLGYIE